MVFMSHKTGDDQAEREAKRITRQHRVEVYMAEWDDAVVGDSNQLPDHIMNAIRRSKGFLVSVIPAIAESMWVGYEIGGAHAMQKSLGQHHVQGGRPPSTLSGERFGVLA